eukprot:6538220-Heterocapsa_arctica.AAC.1
MLAKARMWGRVARFAGGIEPSLVEARALAEQAAVDAAIQVQVQQLRRLLRKQGRVALLAAMGYITRRSLASYRAT